MAKGMNPQAMLKQAQKMQAKIQAVQDEAARETVPEDVEMLQDMIVAAVNEGIADAQAMVEERMSAVTGGMNIPGLF